MKVAILNGSPRGKKSVTMQYIYYLEKKFPDVEFSFIHAARRCKAMEKNRSEFDEAMKLVASSDLVLWAFPLYYLLVQSQMKRFIELLFERKQSSVFKGKYCAALSTSIHFFDNTAHDYVRAISEDLGMNYIENFSAKMDDLHKKDGKRYLVGFFEYIIRYSALGIDTTKLHVPIPQNDFEYRPKKTTQKNVQTAKRIIVITDNGDPQSNTRKMAAMFGSWFDNVDFIHLADMTFSHCVGCYKCGFDNHCSYEGSKDEFLPVFRDLVLKADLLVFALTMKDRYFSSVWQRFLERNFVRTHQPIHKGKQFLFLISGKLSYNANARQILQGWSEAQSANIIGFITDESADSKLIDKQIESGARELLLHCEQNMRRPVSFLGVAGFTIFRDDIFGGLNALFQADHKFYKKHKLYDYPHNNVGKRIAMFFVRLITKIPYIRKVARDQVGWRMLDSYKKILDQA